MLNGINSSNEIGISLKIKEIKNPMKFSLGFKYLKES